MGKDSVGTRGVAAGEGGAGGGMASSQGRKDSGAEGKQLKTARNDSVKAQDKKEKGNQDEGVKTSDGKNREKHRGGGEGRTQGMDTSVSEVTATTSPSTDNDDSKMDTS